MFNFDNSLLSDFTKCETMGILKHFYGLRGKGEKLAANIGNVFHAALEGWFRGVSKEICLDIFIAEYNKIIKEGEEPDQVRFERANCVRIFERFLDTRPPTSFPFKVIEAEQIKGARVGETEEGEELVFWVKRDLLGQDPITGAYMPIDHKTTGKIDASWTASHRLSSQLSGYCWFTGVETQQEVRLAYINAIELSKVPTASKRCAVHGRPYSECGVEHINFQLLQYIRTPEQIEKWHRDVIKTAQYIWSLLKLFPVPLNDLNKMTLKQGTFNNSCRFCEFQTWCGLGLPGELLEQYVIFEPWQPWEDGVIIN